MSADAMEYLHLLLAVRSVFTLLCFLLLHAIPVFFALSETLKTTTCTRFAHSCRRAFLADILYIVEWEDTVAEVCDVTIVMSMVLMTIVLVVAMMIMYVWR